MKQSKTVKKFELKVIQTSETLSELLKNEFTSFKSISYTVEFDLFPGSLLFSCIFNSTNFNEIKNEENKYQKTLHNLLLKKGVILKKPIQNLRFINESSND